MRTRLKSTKRANNDHTEKASNTSAWLTWWIKALIWNPNVDIHPKVLRANEWFVEEAYGTLKDPHADLEDAKKNLDAAFAGVVRLEDRVNTTLVLCFALLAAFMTAASKGVVDPKSGFEVSIAIIAALILLWRRRGVPKHFLILLPDNMHTVLPEIEGKSEKDIYFEYRARCCYVNSVKLLLSQDVLNLTLNTTFVLIALALVTFGARVYEFTFLFCFR